MRWQLLKGQPIPLCQENKYMVYNIRENIMNTNKRTKEYLKASDYLFPEEYISLDLETTGLDPSENEIIEIGAVKVKEGKIIDTYTKLIRPKERISSYITALTGIDNIMVEKEKSIEETLPEFLSFLKDDIILGQNVGFDLDFLYHALDKIQDNRTFHYTDTLKLSRILLPMLAHHRLKDLVEYYQIENEYGYHRALGDCINTMKVYEAMKKEIIDYYGNYEDFLKEPYPVIDKKGCIPKKATKKNIRLASNLKLREDIRKGNIHYFTNQRGMDVQNLDLDYDTPDKEELLYSYSVDPYTEVYEKPFREKKEIKTYLKMNNAILPNKKAKDKKAMITFSPIEVETYLSLKKEGIKVFLSQDVLKFIHEEQEHGKNENH